MKPTEIVQTFITALQAGDMDMAAQYITDNFMFEGWIPQALNKGEFLALQSELHAAMPDYAFNLNDIREQNDVVRALIQITGTQTHPLNLPMFGVHVPYTGVSVILPQEHVEFVPQDGKVARIRVETRPGSGLAGLLQQIGAQLPLSPPVGEIHELAQNEREQEMEVHRESPPWSGEDTTTDREAG